MSIDLLPPHILDWEASVHLSGGDQGIAREIIRVCAIDLNRTRSTLAIAFEAKNTQELRHELHRVKGGVCYLKAPELSDALDAFHTAVKADPQAIEEMEKTFEILLKAIDGFQQTAALLDNQ